MSWLKQEWAPVHFCANTVVRLWKRANASAAAAVPCSSELRSRCEISCQPASGVVCTCGESREILSGEPKSNRWRRESAIARADEACRPLLEVKLLRRYTQSEPPGTTAALPCTRKTLPKPLGSHGHRQPDRRARGSRDSQMSSTCPHSNSRSRARAASAEDGGP